MHGHELLLTIGGIALALHDGQRRILRERGVAGRSPAPIIDRTARRPNQARMETVRAQPCVRARRAAPAARRDERRHAIADGIADLFYLSQWTLLGISKRPVVSFDARHE